MSNKKLNLKNSPPYLQGWTVPCNVFLSHYTGILIETQELLILVFKKNTTDELKANQYLHIFVAKLVAQCKKSLKLFKDAKVWGVVCFVVLLKIFAGNNGRRQVAVPPGPQQTDARVQPHAGRVQDFLQGWYVNDVYLSNK